ncbi:hypothetical protein IMCC20628_04758 (plasmid) [Hoeflea sp. IMCC20628]|uniref:hypothetical protein n=1 Tax=Hoeflea sp. IMCC20628 TaxID=1620421 RepID=UPI00063BF488|nr:hypothetical protein [Hoeflea sp. IMCC20628]AKI03424.1 hypothetical protein IMCC20628_04758 [Hoeflea sp. IMCC20628]
MRLSYMFAVLILGTSATASFGEDVIGSRMESCEKGAVVKDELGATGRIISDVAGVCLVTFPNGTEGVIPGGGHMYPPGSLIRQAALNEVADSGVVVGRYLCTRADDQFQFNFELTGDGSYTLQESAGVYENADRNSISFIDGELDGAAGWMNKGVIGLTIPGADSETRCVVE